MTTPKLLIVVAPTGYQDLEYDRTKKILTAQGIAVQTASLQPGTAQGFLGGTTKIDWPIDRVKAADFSGVAFIGGQGMANLVTNEKFIELARQFQRAGKITAAICVAPKILALAGILKGKKATAWEGVRQDLEQAGAIYTGQPTTKDGRVITADGPPAAEDFGRLIANSLT